MKKLLLAILVIGAVAGVVAFMRRSSAS